ncbi:hypothetical protein VFPFJ_07729 [Purpureocillium lilacinum]|uniref:Uncharacterized protein n=1 Tax=Purpureocillium lilacinum TaxID=33203 RepID=A0A179H6W6_PURLI|nr:hypothetical protein VFPFJ_07729 [Purpureocillium lilacinum]OAQ77659.1 hypothetical protein VFPBJ_08131 [Purpureocillium lilacinum]OAQ85340.1 hypothetical protein VFPFJ_07729 [Purpureocillium lilacinum]
MTPSAIEQSGGGGGTEVHACMARHGMVWGLESSLQPNMVNHSGAIGPKRQSGGRCRCLCSASVGFLPANQ